MSDYKEHLAPMLGVHEVLNALARIRSSLKWVAGNYGHNTNSDIEVLSAAIEEWARIRRAERDDEIVSVLSRMNTNEVKP